MYILCKSMYVRHIEHFVYDYVNSSIVCQCKKTLVFKIQLNQQFWTTFHATQLAYYTCSLEEKKFKVNVTL